MNDLSPKTLPTTQGAEGLPRMRWTVDDLDRLLQADILREDDRVELIGGELVPMAAKGPMHEDLKTALHWWLGKRLIEPAVFAVELGWRPDGDTYLEPDILIFERTKRPSKLPAASVLLLIEVADSSEAFDSGAKAKVYARLGVREYWIIRTKSMTARMHRAPGPDGYADIVERTASEQLVPSLIKDIGLRLAELDVI